MPTGEAFAPGTVPVQNMFRFSRFPQREIFRIPFFVAGDFAWSMRFSPGSAPKLDSKLVGDEDETLMVQPGELWAIVTGPANWEDVWYGYRLHVRKREGAGYYRAFWEMLLNFDDEATSERLAARFPVSSP